MVLIIGTIFCSNNLISMKMLHTAYLSSKIGPQTNCNSMEIFSLKIETGSNTKVKLVSPSIQSMHRFQVSDFRVQNPRGNIYERMRS
jgi:hypothetical protein